MYVHTGFCACKCAWGEMHGGVGAGAGAGRDVKQVLADKEPRRWQ